MEKKTIEKKDLGGIEKEKKNFQKTSFYNSEFKKNGWVKNFLNKNKAGILKIAESKKFFDGNDINNIRVSSENKINIETFYGKKYGSKEDILFIINEKGGERNIYLDRKLMIIIKGRSKCRFNFHIKDGVSEEDLLYIIKDKNADVKIDKTVSNISIEEWEKKEKKIKKYINER